MIETNTMNTLPFRVETILLGVGGRQPGVHVYNALSDRTGTILALDEGHSVYAMDVSPDGKTIAAGTKTGDLYWITQQRDDEDFLVQQWIYGRPVVSISFVGASTIAVADTAGRCFVWQPEEETHLHELSTGKRLIYRSFHLDSCYLAGLSLKGDLLVWDWLKDDLVQVLEAPAPPKDCLALLKPVYWPAAGVWTWPGNKGLIVFYHPRANEVSCVWSGAGEVYALVICGEQLLTIGTDGRTRQWHPGSSEPAGTFEAPHRIVSATSWQENNDVTLLLINDEGEAGVYSLNDTGLEFIKSLPGRDYRTAIGPDAEKLTRAAQQQKMIRVQNLSAQINEKIMRQQYSELEDDYNDLNELGYRHVALALRGRQARSENDCVTELKVYSELTDIIPHDQPGSESALARYAGLLESAWCLCRAYTLYKELVDRYPDNERYADAVRRLSVRIAITETDKYVIVPGLAVSSLIESAIVLGESITGRYLLEARRPVSCRAVLDADEFVKKYEKLYHGNATLPKAEQMALQWLSRDKMEQITTVVFRNEALDRFGHIELGIKFFSTRLQTVLVPVMMLNAGERTDGISVEKYNGRLIRELRHNEDDHFKGWLEMVEQTINHTVCRLINPKKAERIRQSGGIRC